MAGENLHPTSHHHRLSEGTLVASVPRTPPGPVLRGHSGECKLVTSPSRSLNLDYNFILPQLGQKTMERFHHPYTQPPGPLRDATANALVDTQESSGFLGCDLG